jgi:hypothetical protein
VGTNSDTVGHPSWPLTPRIQMFSWHGGPPGSFAAAQYPVYNEANVGFSLTFANLLLQTLPESEGVVLVNTGVGGTGFHANQWNASTGPLAIQSVKVVTELAAAVPAQLGGNYSLHSMLWHQGEQDGGDNRDGYHASYCDYLQADLSPLIDFLRASFPGGSPSTPFIDGGLLPYWVDKEAPGTGGVMEALYALNTSRACTATADSRVFADFTPGGLPNGDPKYRSGASGDVIHFSATQAFFLGFEYFNAYRSALQLTAVVPSGRTSGCGSPVQPPVARCG